MNVGSKFQPQRSGALKKSATLPWNIGKMKSETDISDSTETTESCEDVDIQRRKGYSLTMDRQAVRNAIICPIYDNNQSEEEYFEGSDYDEFTDEDEILYENPAALVELVTIEVKKEGVAREILQTEHTYLEKLTFLRMVKRQLDSMNSVKHIFPPEETNRMFPCIEQLFLLHQSIKLSLERTIRAWRPDSSITSVFIPKLFDFAIYAEFIKSYPLSVKTLESWKSKDERFSKLISIFQQQSSVCLLSLFDVMHEPYIRLQRMKLLFERYSKCLNQDETELQNTKRILKAIDSILSECEGVIQTADDLDTLLKLAERIDGVLAHFANDTRLVKEGSVIDVDPRVKKVFSKPEKSIHLFLFDGFLLICSPVEAGKKQMIRSKVKISAIKILSCDFQSSMGHSSEFSFILQTPSVARIIVCQSAKDANEWKEAFEDTIRQAVKRPSFKRQLSIGTEDFSCAPVWIPDDCVNACMLCLEKFTLIKRRHHCRGCGIIICSSCSPGKLQLPYENFTEGRACGKCYGRARRHRKELLCEYHKGKDSRSSSDAKGLPSDTTTIIRINDESESIDEEEI